VALIARTGSAAAALVFLVVVALLTFATAFSLAASVALVLAAAFTLAALAGLTALVGLVPVVVLIAIVRHHVAPWLSRARGVPDKEGGKPLAIGAIARRIG
jgi:hypothetical protein